MADYALVGNIEDLKRTIDLVSKYDTVALDLETTGLSYLDDSIVGIALSVREAQAIYISLGHWDSGLKSQFDEVIQLLKPYFEDPNRTYVFHNAKFDTRFFRNVGIDIPEESVDDTLLEIFCSGELRQTGYGLKALAKDFYNHRMVEFTELFPKGTKVFNAGKLSDRLVGPYACEDADYTLRLHERYINKVRNAFIYKLEKRLWPTVRYIEDNGFCVDQTYWQQNAVMLEKLLLKVEDMIHETVLRQVGMVVPFNIASLPDLRRVLYDYLGLPILEKTKTGLASCDALTMEKLAKQGYPIAELIMHYNSIQTAIASMKDTLPGDVWSDGKIHTSYLQHGATTGRFSSAGPNIQNIAKDTSWEITSPDGETTKYTVSPRMAFIPDPDHYLVEMDFGQIEFVCMAAFSDENEIAQAYTDGLDIHQATASMVHNVPYETVDEDLRDKAKMYNYLIIYSGTAVGLSRRSDMTVEEADEGIKAFFRRYPNIENKMKEVQNSSKVTKSVATMFGRKQMIPEFFQKSKNARSRADRVGVNRIIQGTAADIQKLGLIGTHKMIVRAVEEQSIPGLRTMDDAKLVAQTHDSQTWTINQRIRPQDILPKLMDAMSPHTDSFGIPRINVDSKVGLNWAKLKKYKPETEYNWDTFYDDDGEEEVLKEEKEENRLEGINVDISGVYDAAQALMDISSLADIFGTTATDVNIITKEGNKGMRISMPFENFELAIKAKYADAVITAY